MNVAAEYKGSSHAGVRPAECREEVATTSVPRFAPVRPGSATSELLAGLSCFVDPLLMSFENFLRVSKVEIQCSELCEFWLRRVLARSFFAVVVMPPYRSFSRLRARGADSATAVRSAFRPLAFPAAPPPQRAEPGRGNSVMDF